MLSIQKFLSVLIGAGSSLAIAVGGGFIAEISIDEIQKGYRKHAALAQFYRWIQFDEYPQPNMRNQLDLLREKAYIKSPLCEMNDHATYVDQVKQLPKNWRCTHFVKSVSVTVNHTSRIDLSADVSFTNQGMRSGGHLSSADLCYNTTLTSEVGGLPKFERIEVIQLNELAATSFDDTYARNRALSLLHYWLSLIENPVHNPEFIHAILGSKFSFNFLNGSITRFEQFYTWLKGPHSLVAASTHRASNFRVSNSENGQFRMMVELDWHGLMRDGSRHATKSRHLWVIADEPLERFTRIERMDVEVLGPLRQLLS